MKTIRENLSAPRIRKRRARVVLKERLAEIKEIMRVKSEVHGIGLLSEDYFELIKDSVRASSLYGATPLDTQQYKFVAEAIDSPVEMTRLGVGLYRRQLFPYLCEFIYFKALDKINPQNQ